MTAFNLQKRILSTDWETSGVSPGRLMVPGPMLEQRKILRQYDEASDLWRINCAYNGTCADDLEEGETVDRAPANFCLIWFAFSRKIYTVEFFIKGKAVESLICENQIIIILSRIVRRGSLKLSFRARSEQAFECRIYRHPI